MVLLSRGYCTCGHRDVSRPAHGRRLCDPVTHGRGGLLTLASGPLGSPAMSVFMNFLGACEHNVFKGGLNPG